MSSLLRRPGDQVGLCKDIKRARGTLYRKRRWIPYFRVVKMGYVQWSRLMPVRWACLQKHTAA